MRSNVDRVRFRTLAISLILACALSIAAVGMAAQIPGAMSADWIPFAVAALIFAGMLPLAFLANRRDDQRALERIAALVLVVAAIAMLQRMVWAMYSPWLDDPSHNPFRPVFQFLPFFFIGAVALLRARRALLLCWTALALVVILTLPGLYHGTGFDLRREGVLPLLTWILLACPLFVLLLHALPHYEEALERSTAEIERMRERTELADRLAVSERRFNLVVDCLQVGIWDRLLGDPEQGWWSPRFYELIGYTPDQLSPSEENLKKLLHPEDRERVFAQGSEQLRKGAILDVNFRLNTAHRGYRWFNSHGKADIDERGKIVRIAGAIADIHDQRVAGQALNEAQIELTRLAYHDTLTELHNRRSFDERFQIEWGRARRNGTELSLLLIDLDHFKLFNDCYGHTAGDQCLRRVAMCIADCARRPGDFAARLGGEEFAVVLPETHAAGAESEARAIHAAIRALAIRHDTSPIGIVTVSIGIATSDRDSTPSELFDRADRALYQVKHNGRDGVLHARKAPAEDTEPAQPAAGGPSG